MSDLASDLSRLKRLEASKLPALQALYDGGGSHDICLDFAASARACWQIAITDNDTQLLLELIPVYEAMLTGLMIKLAQRLDK